MATVRVAIATDDGLTVSEHFGQAGSYVVYEIEDGKIKGKETRPKASHSHPGGIHGSDHGQGAGEQALHQSMLSNVADCQAVFARGMGWGMYQALKQSGMKPYLIEEASADDAVKAFIAGTLVDHYERLH